MTVQLWTHCRAATMQAGAAQPYGLVEDAAIAVEGERLAWVGPMQRAAPDLARPQRSAHDCAGALITPGLIDCHTHLVYGGDRAHEFELRLGGASYEDIARAGGGIASTVRATRAATEAELLAQALPRLRALMSEGVTTIEIKSGYGLSLEHERKMPAASPARLGAARTGGRAHHLPGRPCAAAGIQRAADEYIDGSAAHAAAVARARAGRCGGCVLRAHRLQPGADRARVPGRAPRSACRSSCMPNNSATAVARRWRRAIGALSCDHLEWLGEEGAAAMARAGLRGGASARRVLFPARNPPAARGAAARTWRADGGLHRLQSGQLALHLAAADAEHGLHLVQAHAGRGPGRRDAPCGEGPGPAGSRRAGCGPARRLRALGRRATGPAGVRDGIQSASANRFLRTRAMNFILNRGTRAAAGEHAAHRYRHPPGIARRLRAARTGSGRHGLAPGSPVQLPAGAGCQRIATALLALCDRPEPPAGRRADVPGRGEHRVVPDPFLQRRPALPAGARALARGAGAPPGHVLGALSPGLEAGTRPHQG